MIAVVALGMRGANQLLADEASHPATQKAPHPALPLPALKVTGSREISGRKIVLYQHSALSEWGYREPQDDVVAVIPPQTSRNRPPLCVVPHSSDVSGPGFADYVCTSNRPTLFGDNSFYVLCLDCRKNREHDWWWGYHEIARHPERYRDALCPTEKRVLSTVAWAIQEFAIDPNRVYLSGISMGGSGSLGIGMIRGDIFAAISVITPAGVEHAHSRLREDSFPDPPPVVNVSSQTDKYAAGQESFLRFCAERKLAHVFGWGPFGHDADAPGVNLAVMEFPWLQIRRNEAYPVFTRTTTDQKYPGLMNKTDPDQNGQINAYFRWKNLEDTKLRFAIELRLVKAQELGASIDIPRESTADVTLRRLQNFPVRNGEKYRWTITAEGKTTGSGIIVAEEAVLTVPRITITAEPLWLSIEPG